MSLSIDKELLNTIKRSVLHVVNELNANTPPSSILSIAQHFKLMFMIPITTPSVTDFLLLKSNVEGAKSFIAESEYCALIPLGFQFSEAVDFATCPYVGYPSFLDPGIKKAMLSLLSTQDFPFLTFFPNHSLLRQDPNDLTISYKSLLQELIMVKEFIEVEKISIVIDGESSLVEAIVICQMCQHLGIQSIQLGHALSQLCFPRECIDYLMREFPTLHFAVYLNECFIDYFADSPNSHYLSLVVPHTVPGIFSYSCQRLTTVNPAVVELINTKKPTVSFARYILEEKSASKVSLNVLRVDRIKIDRFWSSSDFPSFIYWYSFMYAYSAYTRISQTPVEELLRECTLPKETLTLFAEIIPIMCGFFHTKVYRQKMLFKLLEELFPESMGFTWFFAVKSGSVLNVSTGDCISSFIPSFEWRPDIALFHSVLKIPLLIVEVKNERSSKTESDPLAQCLTYYCQFACREDSSQHCFGCPCFLMLSDGTHIYIYGVTVLRDNEIRCSLLFDFEFSIHSDCAVFIRAFEILKQSIIMLVNEFHDFFSYINTKLDDSAFILLSKVKRNTPAVLRRGDLHAECYPSNFETSTGSFLTLIRNKNSIEAQSVMAKLGHSPPVQQVLKIGDWYCVSTESAFKKSPLNVIDLEDRLNKFHQMGFVHGDVRDCNLVNGFLIDFETAGLVGHARYPITWNVARTVDRHLFYPKSPFPFKSQHSKEVKETDEERMESVEVKEESDEEEAKSRIKIYPGLVLFNSDARRVKWHQDVGRLGTILPDHDDFTYRHVNRTSTTTDSSRFMFNLSSMISPQK
ncbi:hypothetical protein RCL1_006673 [Eukaryota sp. TZLM3-RCL]